MLGIALAGPGITRQATIRLRRAPETIGGGDNVPLSCGHATQP